MQHGQVLLVVVKEHGLGDFKLQPGGGQSALSEDRLEDAWKIVLLELRRRHVDRELEMRRPLCCVGAGFAQDPLAERNDQSAFLRQRDELVGGYEAALGMAPANQRLDAASLELACIDDRLVVQLELIARDR